LLESGTYPDAENQLLVVVMHIQALSQPSMAVKFTCERECCLEKASFSTGDCADVSSKAELNTHAALLLALSNGHIID
jgi:hypothetical protein